MIKLFGSHFYHRIKKLMPWQRALFCTALAQRMLANVELYAQQTTLKPRAFRKGLMILWRHLAAPRKEVNLDKYCQMLETEMPDVEDESFGVYAARHAYSVLVCAYHALITRAGSEARQGSDVSMQTVVDFVEVREECVLVPESLYQHPLIDTELTFQVELLRRVSNPRDVEMIQSVYDFVSAQGVSNLGIVLDDGAVMMS